MAFDNNQQRADALFSMQGYQLPSSAYPGLPGLDYGAQARYGVAPAGVNPLAGVPPLLIPYHAIPGPVHAIPDSLRPYNHLGLIPMRGHEQLAYDSEALAENLERLQLNPMAKEYVPPRGGRPGYHHRGMLLYDRKFPGGDMQRPVMDNQAGRGRMPPPVRGARGQKQTPKKKKFQKGLEDNVKRTVYISYIDQQVTEEQLAGFFSDCGKVIDCRICGDPNSAMRFAFIEFTESEAVQQALSKTGTVLGSSPLRVLPSKTAIVPVNKELMPRTQDELERCSRTVYAANIDKKVDRSDVKHFFEQLCGKVAKIRLLGDFAHSTRIAFIEFTQAEGAMAALNCSGALLGSLPIRVSPSKTPVRAEAKETESSSS